MTAITDTRPGAASPHAAADAHPLRAFVERALAEPAAPALTWPGGSWTYADLYARTCDAAARLEYRGVAGRVAVLGPKSPDAIALVLACMLTGRPVLVPAVELPRPTVDTLIERAGVAHVLPAEASPPRLSDFDPVADVSDDDVAVMLTTSGSTGLPKVVPITFGAITRFAAWAAERFAIEPGTAVLSYCGLNFDLSILEVWTTLLYGGRAVLVSAEEATRPDHLRDLVLEHGVGVLQGVPMLTSLLVEAGTELPGVRHVILTGDATPPTLLAQLPGPFTNARFSNVYGCTETNDSFVHEIDVRHGGPVPLGEPLPGVRHQLVESGRVVEGEGAGELWVSTPFQASGYLGRPDTDDGFGTDGFYRTRDLVRRDASGMLFLEGRTDSQVKVRGVRVNLQAVEQALLGDDTIVEAAVFAVEEALAGRRLIAVVRRGNGAAPDTLKLRARCARELGRIAVPATIEVQHAALPRTATGKVDRNAVRANWQRGGT